VPYPALLPLQILLIGCMAAIASDHSRGSGPMWVSPPAAFRGRSRPDSHPCALGPGGFRRAACEDAHGKRRARRRRCKLTVGGESCAVTGKLLEGTYFLQKYRSQHERRRFMLELDLGGIVATIRSRNEARVVK
jgi:hypothetical protein